MPRALPPWLNVAPTQFTEAAISGAQLGAKGATEAAQLGLEAQKIAQQAQEIQARRDAIGASFAAVNQRASEASMENAIRQRQVGLQEQVRRDAAAKMAANDTVWNEGMSRYQRAVNAGDDPGAADLEILQPLREGGFGKESSGKTSHLQSPSPTGRNRIFQLPGGNLVSVDPQGNAMPVETGITMPKKAGAAVATTPEVPNTESQRRNFFAGSKTMQDEESQALSKLSQPGADAVEILGVEHPTLLQHAPYAAKFGPIYSRALNQSGKSEKVDETKEPKVSQLASERATLSRAVGTPDLPENVAAAYTQRIADIDKQLSPPEAEDSGDSELVAVINPKGQPVKIRSGQLQQALKSGYKER